MDKCCERPSIRTFAFLGDGRRTDGCDACGKEVETYAPELGQAVFGNPTGGFDFDKLPDAHVLDHMLRVLAHYATGDTSYAGEFDNTVFEMHPYYWDDCTCGYEEQESEWDGCHEHAVTCYQTEYEKVLAPLRYSDPQRDKVARRLCVKYGIPWNKGQGVAVHCTCTYQSEWQAFRAKHSHAKECPTVRPNFRHKAGGLEIRWYKYIGRGMTVNRHACPECFRDIFAECMNSLVGFRL